MDKRGSEQQPTILNIFFHHALNFQEFVKQYCSGKRYNWCIKRNLMGKKTSIKLFKIHYIIEMKQRTGTNSQLGLNCDERKGIAGSKADRHF